MHVGRDGLLNWPATTLIYTTRVVPPILKLIAYPEFNGQMFLTKQMNPDSNICLTPAMQAIIQGISPQIILADSIILNKQVIPVECYVANQPGLTKEDWKQLQSADPTLSMVMKHLKEKTWNDRKRPKNMPIQLKLYYRVRKNLVFKEGILYKKNCANNAKGRETTLQLLLPRKLIPEVLQSCHDDMGHQGRQRTLA